MTDEELTDWALAIFCDLQRSGLSKRDQVGALTGVLVGVLLSIETLTERNALYVKHVVALDDALEQPLDELEPPPSSFH